MIWILAVITTLGGVTPDVSIMKVSTFPDQQKCEQTRRNMQERSEPGQVYICVKHAPKDK
jgi:hypothetical protein